MPRKAAASQSRYPRLSCCRAARAVARAIRRRELEPCSRAPSIPVPLSGGPRRSRDVTALPKTVLRSPELGFTERTLPLARGDVLDAVLRANNAAAEDSRAIVAALGRDRAIAGEGQQMRILAAPAARPGEARRIVRAMVLTERGIEAIAA